MRKGYLGLQKVEQRYIYLGDKSVTDILEPGPGLRKKIGA